MADVQPFKALHYDLAKVGSLDKVAAPPYDVIDAAGRARLMERSPYNAVAIDLPKAFDPADPLYAPEGDPYANARATMDAWRAEGVLVDDAEPAVWALTQDYTAPDGSKHSRHGILCRVRVEDYETGTVRPHERTHPGPLEDRLLLTRATLHNLSPIFSLSTADAWPLLEPAVQGEDFLETEIARLGHAQRQAQGMIGRRAGHARRHFLHRADAARGQADGARIGEGDGAGRVRGGAVVGMARQRGINAKLVACLDLDPGAQAVHSQFPQQRLARRCRHIQQDRAIAFHQEEIEGDLALGREQGGI